MLASSCSLTKRYLRWPHWKIHRTTDCMHLEQPGRKTLWQNTCTCDQLSVTDGISRRVTSGRQYTSLIIW